MEETKRKSLIFVEIYLLLFVTATRCFQITDFELTPSGYDNHYQVTIKHNAVSPVDCLIDTGYGDTEIINFEKSKTIDRFLDNASMLKEPTLVCFDPVTTLANSSAESIYVGDTLDWFFVQNVSKSHSLVLNAPVVDDLTFRITLPSGNDVDIITTVLYSNEESKLTGLSKGIHDVRLKASLFSGAGLYAIEINATNPYASFSVNVAVTIVQEIVLEENSYNQFNVTDIPFLMAGMPLNIVSLVEQNDAVFYLFSIYKDINETVILLGGSCETLEPNEIIFSHVINITGQLFLEWQLSNYISEVYAATDFISYYAVNEFNINVSEPIALYSTELIFTIAINPIASLAMGNVNCELYYDKTQPEKEQVSFDLTPDKFEELQNTLATFQHYYTAGWYTARVLCYNELADVIDNLTLTHLDIDVDIIVENPVENIILRHNSTNIFLHPWSKPILFTVELFNDTVLPIFNVSCVIQYGNTGVEPLVTGDLTPFSYLNHSQRLPGADAEITVYVHCSNYLTSMTMKQDVYVYFDCWKTQAFFDNVYKNKLTSMTAYTNENLLLKAAIWLTFNCEPPIETWWEFYKVEDNGTEVKHFEHIPPIPSIAYTIKENTLRDGLYRIFLTCYYPQFKRTPKLRDNFYLRLLLPNVRPVLSDGNVETIVSQKKTDQQFIIDSSLSTDPAGSLSHIQPIPLVRTWDCITGDNLDGKETLGYLISQILPLTANQDCSELLSSNDAESYEIPASNMILNQWYIFTFNLTRGDRSAQKSIALVSRPLDPLPVSIRCLQNCHPGSSNVEKLIIDDLHLNVELGTDGDISGASYNWTLEKFEDGKFIDLTSDLFNTQSTGLHVTKEWLQSHFKKDELTKFQVTCTVQLSGFHVSSDVKQYVINLPPYGGNCSLSYNGTAIAGVTLICFNCSNWKDEGVNEERDPANDRGGALKYVAIQRFLDNNGNVISNIPGIARTPTGNVDQCFQLERLPSDDLNNTRLEVHILDTLTEPSAIVEFDISVENPLPAVVTPLNGTDLIEKLMKENEELLLQYSSLNDFQGTADIVASIASVISVQVELPPAPIVFQMRGRNGFFTDFNGDGSSELVSDAMNEIGEPVIDPLVLKLQETNQFLVETIKNVMEKLNQSEVRDINSNRQLISAVRQIANGPEQNVANETANELLEIAENIIISMNNIDNDDPTARKLKEETSVMIQAISMLVVPDISKFMHTGHSLSNMRKLGNNLQIFASPTLLNLKEQADFTEDERVFFNSVNQKHIAYVVSVKIKQIRKIDDMKKRYENDLLNNYAMSDGSVVNIGDNNKSAMALAMTTDKAQILAAKEVTLTSINVSVPGLGEIDGKARILMSDLTPLLNLENSGRFAHMTSTQKRLVIDAPDELTGTVALTEEIPPTEYQSFAFKVDPDDASKLMYYTMNVRSADDDIRIRILPDPGDREILMFNVYVNFDEDVTIRDHAMTADCKSPDWTATFSSSLLKENNFISGNLNFAIKPVYKEITTEENTLGRKRREAEEKNGTNETQTSFKLATTTAACTVWDEQSEMWKSDVCQGVWNADENKFTCNCPARREMTFTNSFYVAPNTIDYSTVFLKFSPHDQAAVIAVLVLIFILYILVVIWARWQDRKDLLKWGVTPLADNFPEDSYFYVIKVFTGMRAGAGTRSRVSFVVGGEEIDTGIRALSDGVRKEIPTGSVMNFLMSTRTCLGDLEYLRIWHDNSGSGNHASWYLSKIEIHDVQLKEAFVFQAERWLAIEKDDGLLESVFPVSKSENYNVFKNRFVLNAKENLAESHMWVSVAYRPQASNFTRVQRASCALVFIMMSMIANAAYFQSSNQENYDLPSEIIVGPFRFSLQQIYVSFITALIVTPATLVVIYLFKKSNVTLENTDVTRMKKVDKSKRYRIPLFDDWLERERLQSLELERHLVEKGNPKIEGFKLPETFYYLAWLITVGTVFTCAFYLLLFSAQWGKQKSEEWLTTFILSFFESVFCLDPIKVAFMALTFAILFRSTKQKQADIDRKNILRNYTSTLKNRSGGVRKPAPPLDEEKLNSAREWRKFELQMRKAVRNVVLNIFHAWILFSIAYSNLDSQSYLLHEEIKGSILEPGDQPQFSSVSTIDEFFDWLNDTVIVNMFPENDYTGRRLPWRVRQLINDGSNLRVGPPRLRQLRTKKKKPCSIPYIESEDCLKKYSTSTEDDGDYCLSWKDGPCDQKEETYQLSSSAWKYTSAFDIWGLPIAGIYSSYGGGGYIAELSVNRNVSQLIVQEMYDNLWVDRQTRGIFFEFTLYCVNSNIFVYSVFLVEFPETGGALPYSMIFPLRVYQHLGPTGKYTLACEIIFLVYLLGFTVVSIINLYQQRKAYFSVPWQVYDLVFLMFSYTSVIFYVIRIVMINDSLEVFLTDKKSFVNFYHVAIWNLTFVVMIGILCFMATLRLMNSLGYNKRIRKTAEVFRNAARDLLSFAIFFICYYFFYAFFGYLLFGSKLEPYKNIVKTLETLFLSLLGATTLTELEESDPVMAKIYFITFIMFMVYFVMTMFMAILCEAIDEINAESYVDKDGEVVDFMLDKLKDMFMFGGRAKKRPVSAPTFSKKSEENEMKFGDGRPLPEYFTNRTVLEYIRDSMFDALQDYRNTTGSMTEMSSITKSKTSFDKF